MLNRLLGTVWMLLLLLLAIAPSKGYAQDPLSALNDNFTDPATLSQWHRVYVDEQWGANQLQSIDIGSSLSGWLTMVPYTCTTFQDYRGPLAFKLVTGNFAVTTRVRVSGRDGTSVPMSRYSLGGLMARAAGPVRSQWLPGGHENYVFLSLGAADPAGTLQYEVKTTTNSNSQLTTTPATSQEAYLQVARLGRYFILLSKVPNQSWTVMARFDRQDLPAQLQVGMCCYTDWDTASTLDAFTHNSTQITWGNPDLIARFHYMHYQTPVLPPSLVGVDLTDTTQVPDSALIGFLGDQVTW